MKISSWNLTTQPRSQNEKSRGGSESCRTALKHRSQLTVRIPVVVAVSPREPWGERGYGVEQSPGSYDHVVGGDEAYYHDGAVAQALERRRHAAEREGRSYPRVLANHQLQEEYGQTHGEQHQGEGNQERTWIQEKGVYF